MLVEVFQEMSHFIADNVVNLCMVERLQPSVVKYPSVHETDSHARVQAFDHIGVEETWVEARYSYSIL